MVRPHQQPHLLATHTFPTVALSPARRTGVLVLATAFLLGTTFHARALDAFDPASNLLTLDAVSVGGTTYNQVRATVHAYTLLGIDGGTPVTDTFVPASGLLTLGAVAFQGSTYNNVRATVRAYTLQSVGSGGLVGMAGMAAWDALAPDQKARVNTTMRSFFLHQSVGGDLEDGAQALGFKFAYADSNATSLADGLNGGLFASGNGNPAGKVAEFRRMALANRNGLGVAIMKFGYADIVADKLLLAQADYLAAVNALRAQGIRVLHVTPPLVYNAPDENAPKMQMRSWMQSTFAQDTIFDLQDVESTDPDTGARCERAGAWEICEAVRSTAGCPSKSQGVDAPSGQGHVCFNPHAQRLAKAFLYAIYRSQL